eukprot:SAG25_NODE_2877_length_1339_cov_2.026613_1_plen_54_part_10
MLLYEGAFLICRACVVCREVLVRWRGFGPQHNSWEPRHVIAKAAPEMMAAADRL